MTRVTALNVAAALLSLAVSAWAALPARSPNVSDAKTAREPVLHAAATVVHEHGRDGLRDATGHFVALDDFQRIASTNGVTDSLLLALAEPTRIASFTRFSAENSPYAYRFAGKPLLVDLANLEALVAIHPDLVLVNSLGSADRIQHLREAGLRVFDLGELRGMATLPENIVTVATLLGRPELGRSFAAHFERQMQAIAQHVPARDRPSALYISVYGDAIYGGAAGTSYHDVMVAGGLRDAAAERYRDWPHYTPETLLTLDPDVIVTHTGMARTLCAHPGLEQLRACRSARVIEISGSLLDDPSLTMLDAAEAVYEGVHGAAR